jgi:hypothetical protein
VLYYAGGCVVSNHYFSNHVFMNNVIGERYSQTNAESAAADPEKQKIAFEQLKVSIAQDILEALAPAGWSVVDSRWEDGGSEVENPDFVGSNKLVYVLDMQDLALNKMTIRISAPEQRPVELHDATSELFVALRESGSDGASSSIMFDTVESRPLNVSEGLGYNTDPCFLVLFRVPQTRCW